MSISFTCFPIASSLDSLAFLLTTIAGARQARRLRTNTNHAPLHADTKAATVFFVGANQPLQNDINTITTVGQILSVYLVLLSLANCVVVLPSLPLLHSAMLVYWTKFPNRLKGLSLVSLLFLIPESETGIFGLIYTQSHRYDPKYAMLAGA